MRTATRRRGAKALWSGRLSMALALAALLAGCAGDEDGGGTTGPSSKPAPAETADKLPDLPAGWQEFESTGAGFALGLPPGWEHGRLRGDLGTVFTSPDGLVTVSVTADRTSGALELPLAEFARRTAAALGASGAGGTRFEPLEIERPRDFDAAYPAVAVAARGTPADSKTPEDVLVVAIRRPRLASFVAVVRANGRAPSPYATDATIERMIASISDRPIT